MIEIVTTLPTFDSSLHKNRILYPTDEKINYYGHTEYNVWIPLSGKTYNLYTSDEITTNKVVYIDDDGFLYISDNSDSDTLNVIGITVTLGSYGSKVLVFGEGCILKNILVGATVGSSYYLGTNGVLTSSMPLENVVKIGTAINSTDLKIEIQTPSLSSSVPTGTIIPWASDTIPDGWLECNGAAVSSSDFRNLHSFLSDKYGNGSSNEQYWDRNDCVSYNGCDCDVECYVDSCSCDTACDSYEGIVNTITPICTTCYPAGFTGCFACNSIKDIGIDACTQYMAVTDADCEECYNVCYPDVCTCEGNCYTDTCSQCFSQCHPDNCSVYTTDPDYGTEDFNVPDLRGYFIRGWNNGKTLYNGVIHYRGGDPSLPNDIVQYRDPDCLTRSAYNVTGSNISSGDNIGTIQDSEFSSHSHVYTQHCGGASTIPGYPQTYDGNVYPYANATYKETNQLSSINETRPSNISVRFIIKT